MNQDYKPWLPKGAIRFDALAVDIAGAISAWQERWLPDTQLQIGNFEIGKLPISNRSTVAFESLCNDAEIGLSSAAKNFLTSEILGADLEKLKLEGNNQKPLDHLFRECLSDLGNCLCEAMAMEPVGDTAGHHEPVAADRWLITKNNNDETIFTLKINDALVVRYSKATIARTLTHQDLESRWSATGSAKLALGSRIGGCQISLSDMTELQVGDVVKLDSALTDELDLAVNGSVVVKKNLTLTQRADDLSLTLCANE